MNKYLVIPVYNEEKVIVDVITELKKHGFHKIIVVDDGSSDNTFSKAKSTGVIVLRHFINRGKGAAVKTGLEAAKILSADAVATCDGDGQHEPADVEAVMKELSNGYDVVLGSRPFNTREMPLFNFVANYLGNIITWVAYGTWVNDSQSGLRAYSKKALEKMNTQTDRYEYDSEVIKEISVHKLSFCEVPIKIKYTAHSLRKKHKQSALNGLKTFINIIRK